MPVWALVVGINQYPKELGLNDLKGAVADACDFAEWALDPVGGAVPPENFYFWTHPWPKNVGGALGKFLKGPQTKWKRFLKPPDKPDKTRGPIAWEIVSTAETVGREARHHAVHNGIEETRRIYVFFAGHGLRAQEENSAEQTCFLAYDFQSTESRRIWGVVGCASLRDSLLAERFHEAIFFLDCCRSPAARASDKATAIADTARPPAGVPWVMGQAAEDGKVALETKTRPVRGVFSKTLMQGLRKHRKGRGNQLYIEALRDYVNDHVYEHLPKGESQIPNIYYDPPLKRRILIAKGAVKAPLHVAPPPPSRLLPGPVVHSKTLPKGTKLILRNGANKKVGSVPTLTFNGRPISLPPLKAGLYSVEVENDPQKHTTFRHPGTAKIDVG